MNYSRYSDEQLVAKFLRGDKESFVELVSRYSKPIYNLAYRFTGDIDDANDLVQEVFTRAYKSLPKSKIDLPFRPWIYKIATNLCINWAKKKKPVSFSQLEGDDLQESILKQIPDEKPPPSELFDQRNLQEILQKAILKLPIKYQSVVILRYAQELTFEEIANILELPLGTVKTHFFRAKKLLKFLLKDQI